MDSPNQPVVSPSPPVVVPDVVGNEASPPPDAVSSVRAFPDQVFSDKSVVSPQSVGSPQSVVSPNAPVSSADRRIVTTFGSDVVSSLQSLLGTVVIAIFVITFIVQAFQIPSESMENTLLVGDYLLVNKLCYGGRGMGDHLMPYQRIERGDIIVFHYPVDPQQHFVKRVIGVPGDRLRLVNKRVWLNGSPLTEPYVRHIDPSINIFRDDFPRVDLPAIMGMEGDWWLQMKKLVEDGQLIVPQGHYFVMGDNRDDSQDSRFWGFVPRENIIGRPLVIYWSVRDWDQSPSASFEGRLHHLAYAVVHFFQITRWNRTLRLVH